MIGKRRKSGRGGALIERCGTERRGVANDGGDDSPGGEGGRRNKARDHRRGGRRGGACRRGGMEQPCRRRQSSARSPGSRFCHALLSRNENPYGPSPEAIEAACEASKNGAYHADRSAPYLADMIAERNGVMRDVLSISAGSGDGLCAAATEWMRSGGKIPASLFRDVTARGAGRQGATIVRAPFADDLGVDLAAMEAMEALVDETERAAVG